MVGLGVIAPILPLYVQSFGASGAQLGLVFAAFSISRFLLGPLVGRLSDRVGRKRLIVVGLGVYTLVSLLYVVAQTLWQLGAFRFVQGIASVMVTPIAQAYVGDLTPPGREGRTMNLFYASMFVGQALGPLLGGYLAEAWSLQAPFYAMGILSLLSLIGVTAFVPEDTRGRRPTPPRTPLAVVVRIPVVEAIIVYMATRGFWRQGFNAFWPLLASQAGFGEATIGMVLTAYLAGEAVFQIPFGYLADRFRRLPQITIGGVLAPAILFLVPVCHSLVGVLALVFGMGAASALGRASIIAIRTEYGRTYGMGTLAGIQGSAFAAGQSLGPVISGLAHDLGGLAAPMHLGGSLGMVGALGAVALLTRHLGNGNGHKR